MRVFRAFPTGNRPQPGSRGRDYASQLTLKQPGILTGRAPWGEESQVWPSLPRLLDSGRERASVPPFAPKLTPLSPLSESNMATDTFYQPFTGCSQLKLACEAQSQRCVLKDSAPRPNLSSRLCSSPQGLVGGRKPFFISGSCGVASLLSGAACLLTSWVWTALVLSGEGLLSAAVVPFFWDTHLQR